MVLLRALGPAAAAQPDGEGLLVPLYRRRVGMAPGQEEPGYLSDMLDELTSTTVAVSFEVIDGDGAGDGKRRGRLRLVWTNEE